MSCVVQMFVCVKKKKKKKKDMNLINKKIILKALVNGCRRKNSNLNNFGMFCPAPFIEWKTMKICIGFSISFVR